MEDIFLFEIKGDIKNFVFFFVILLWQYHVFPVFNDIVCVFILSVFKIFPFNGNGIVLLVLHCYLEVIHALDHTLHSTLLHGVHPL